MGNKTTAAHGDAPRVDVRGAYDTVACAYEAQFADELDRRPLERALLTAFVDMAGSGTIADVGCGPGHVTSFLAALGAETVGFDLSPAMVDRARRRAPDSRFAIASMLELPADDDAWAGAVALYSIIHLTREDRMRAFHELARVVRSGGLLLVSFHVDSAAFASGEINHLDSFLGHEVRLDGYFLDPPRVEAELAAAEFAVTAKLERRPLPETEYPSRRCYLLSERAGAGRADAPHGTHE